MNVVIEDVKQSKPTLRAGDIVVHTTGDVSVMATLPLNEERLLSASLSGFAVTDPEHAKTPDEWIRFWDHNYPGYTIYPADQYELVLRRK